MSSRPDQPATLGVRPDLRARRKAATRDALLSAAFELFAAVGYEAATISQIAERAGIGERTFFKHFPSKEDVLFLISEEELSEFSGIVSEQNQGLDDLDALERSVIAFRVDSFDDQRFQMLQLLVSAAATSTVIRGKQLDYISAFAEAAALGLARRKGHRTPDEATLLLAHVATQVFHRAVLEWVQRSKNDLNKIVHRKFSMLRQVICDGHHDNQNSLAAPATSRKRTYPKHPAEDPRATPTGK